MLEDVGEVGQGRARWRAGGPEVIRGAGRGDGPVREHDDVLEKVLDLRDLVSHDDDRRPLGDVLLEQRVPEAASDDGVHPQVHLVQEQHGGVRGEREGRVDGGALPLGEPARDAVDVDLEGVEVTGQVRGGPQGPGRAPQLD